MEYFSEDDRLDRIISNLANLEFVPSKGIENFAGERTFTKIYASNAVGELYSKVSLDVYIANVAIALQDNGLLYVSNGAEISNLVPNMSKLGLKLEATLTKRAMLAERIWTQNIYRKVALKV